MTLGFAIDNWCACSPELDPADDTRFLDDETSLNVSFLPAMSRRRLSKLSKLCLRLAHEVAPGYQGYCVFGSQHGEIVTTTGLIDSIVQGELVSPAGFSSSVHNTSVGLHSINNKNTYPCTSLAAGIDTLAVCFIEASALLYTTPAEQVLVVVADDLIPDVYEPYLELNQKRGFAALISKAEAKASFEVHALHSQQVDKSVEPVANLATFLVKGEAGACDLPGELFDWQWRYYV